MVPCSEGWEWRGQEALGRRAVAVGSDGDRRLSRGRGEVEQCVIDGDLGPGVRIWWLRRTLGAWGRRSPAVCLQWWSGSGWWSEVQRRVKTLLPALELGQATATPAGAASFLKASLRRSCSLHYARMLGGNP